ncbi:unannotated protein [freshwater metagenome]|uniref:Unannotated protein n=1 Tax=freshwater metagenome TaxID=449393 RepID=A0A6J6D8X7_9ZZZZ
MTDANAPTAICHSNRHAMNSDTMTKNTNNAWTALVVTPRPHEELTLSTLISDELTPAFSANADFNASTTPGV